MGHIIHIHGHPHRDTQELLPWHVTGRLDAGETALVEAHLAACAECRGALEAERKLASEMAMLPLDAEAGWSELRRHLVFAPSRSGPFRQAGQALRRAFAWPGKVGWLMAGQLAVLVVVAIGLLPREGPAPYHTLGNTTAQRTGNVVVVFRTDTREQDLRRTLNDSRARLVDGPTAAGAYVLEVPAADRPSIIAALQRQPNIVLAQPVDAPR